MANEQYLTEKHYLICSKGAKPKHVKVTSQSTVKFSGNLAATEADKQCDTNFICAGAISWFGLGAVLGVASLAAPAIAAACACIPGPGWVVAGMIAVAIVAALLIAGGKCKKAAASRFWNPETTSQKSKLNGNHLLMLSSQMICPQEGGCITAEKTFWAAYGKQAFQDLGYVSDFAFGFLAGRGAGTMVSNAAKGAGSLLTKEGATTFAKNFGKDFLTTAKDNVLQQFTGWNQGGFFCRAMKGLGLYGEVKQYADIWTDDEKSLLDKITASGLAFILDVFAAKGATTVCFPAGTKVHTQWGLANIERLEVGVPILTYNVETGEQEYKSIKKLLKRTTQRMCAVELSNGEVLEVTPEHRFYNAGNWVALEDLNVGDTLQTKDNVLLVIENKAIISTFTEVFNLEIEDNENYYVTEDGILVHNGYISDRKGETIDRDLLDKPETRGNAPTFKEDGKPVEIHHRNQNPEGPFDEMHPNDHRGAGNYTINHPNSGQRSQIDRKIFAKQKREYWNKIFDNWPNE